MITAATGRLGSGKTAFLAWLGKHYFEEGRKVATNFWVAYPHEPLFHPFQLVFLRDCVFLGDEFHEWVSSVGSQRKVQIALSKIYRRFRKKNVHSHASSQRFMNIHIRYREICDVQFRMKRFPPGPKEKPIKHFMAYPCRPYEYVPIEKPIRFYPEECYDLFDTDRDLYCFEDEREEQEIADYLASIGVREFLAGKIDETRLDELVQED